MLARITITPTFLLLLFFVTTSSITHASEDAYLKQLEMEAGASSGQTSETGSDEKYSDQLNREADDTSENSPGTSPATGNSQELVVDKKELIHDFASFERALKRDYPENYQMYEAFNDDQKKQVYNSFLTTKRLYNASVKITLIYIKTH